jgi:polysaccharide biosynthesis transport protein
MQAGPIPLSNTIPQVEPDNAPLTLRDYLSPVLARKWWVIGFVIVLAAAGYAYGAGKPPVYKASTQLYVAQQGNPALGVGAGFTSDRTIADQAALVTTKEVSAIVAQQIGYRGSPQSLGGSVTATPATGEDIITIAASASSAARAATIANAFARAFIQLSTQQGHASVLKSLTTLQEQLKRLPPGASTATQRSNIQTQIEQLQVAESSGIGNASQINPATPPASASSRPTWEYTLLAAIAALISSTILAYVLQRLDPRVKSVLHALAIYDRPVLATVTEDDEIQNAVKDGRPALSEKSREVFRELRINLELSAPDGGLKTILLTSASSGEGKSSVARNTALAFSEVGRKVALVDADLRKPTIPKIMGFEGQGGVTEVVAGLKSLEEVAVHVPISDSGNVGHGAIKITGSGEFIRGSENGANGSGSTITVVPAGRRPPNPPAILESANFAAMLKELADTHDIVIIDSPPLTVVSDVIPILRDVDALMMVVRSGVTDARSARHAAEIIGRVPDANFVGIAVNGLPPAEAAAYGAGYGYYYRYGGYGHSGRYGYGYGDENEGDKGRRRGAASKA